MEWVSLRPATPADADEIGTLYLRSRRELVACAPMPWSEAEVREWVRGVLIPAGGTWVAEAEGAIVGMMSLDSDEGGGWIEQLYLLPEWVGRGVGTRLLALARARLRPPIRLHTFQCNQAARRFYQARGFVVLDERDGRDNAERCPDLLLAWQPAP